METKKFILCQQVSFGDIHILFDLRISSAVWLVWRDSAIREYDLATCGHDGPICGYDSAIRGYDLAICGHGSAICAEINNCI